MGRQPAREHQSPRDDNTNNCRYFMINTRLLMAGVIASAALVTGCNQETSEKPSAEMTLETLEQKVSYTIAADIAGNLKQRDFVVDTEAFVAAFNDVNSDAEL